MRFLLHPSPSAELPQSSCVLVLYDFALHAGCRTLPAHSSTFLHQPNILQMTISCSHAYRRLWTAVDAFDILRSLWWPLAAPGHKPSILERAQEWWRPSGGMWLHPKKELALRERGCCQLIEVSSCTTP